MPSNATAKTKWAPKRLLWAGLLVLAVCAGVVAYRTRVFTPRQALTVGTSTYRLDVARSEAAKEKGLGGRASMPADVGMLFPYANQARQCFWMKDMRFALDIIWVGSNHRVTYVAHSLAPSTYPATYCADGQYVLELNAGQAVQSNIRVGTTLLF